MEKNYETSLPLFLNLEAPVAVYIIDDRLALFQSYGGADTRAVKSYNLLHKIYQSTKASSRFPLELKLFFEKKHPIPTHPYFDFNLVGCEELGNCYLCFDLDIAFKMEKPIKVILRDLSFMRKPLNIEISLPVDKATQIFANICANSLCKNLNFNMLRSKNQIDSEFETHHIENSKRYNMPKELIKANLQIMLFGYGYFKYLTRQLLAKKISPLQILNNSGARLLVNLLDLPPVSSFLDKIYEILFENEFSFNNQTIAYYTFLRLAKSHSNNIADNAVIDKINEKFARYKEQFIAIEKRLEKHSPRNFQEIPGFFSKKS